MSIAVSVAVHPDAVGPNGTHPMLVLFADGRIAAFNGVIVPLIAAEDTWGFSSWNTPRFYALGASAGAGPTPTAGVPNGEIGRKIVVTNWNLADPKGHVLDGWGRIIPFGTGTLHLVETGNWGPPLLPGVGQDVARSLLINPADATSGYVMDNAGALHRCGNQATNPNAFPPPYPGYDYAVDFACDFSVAPSGGFGGGAHGLILGAGGEVTMFQHPNDPWIFGTIYGSHYYAPYPIMRSIDFNFLTDLSGVGYVMDGFGTPWAVSYNDPSVGDPGRGEQLDGGPYSRADIYQQFVWPKKSSLFFVSLADNGTAIPWQKFVKPTVTYSAMGNTSRPSPKFTYGPSSGTPAVAPLSQVTAYMYPFSVTQAADFKAKQATGAIWSWKRSGIIGTEGGEIFEIGPASEFVINDDVVDELPNGYHYVLYVQVVSTENVKSGFVALDQTTAYTGITAPGLTATPLPDDPAGRRVRLNASGLGGGQVYDYQFSDDNIEWHDVIGASATTSSPVYDVTALPLKPRWYRVFKVTPSPWLRSNPGLAGPVTMAMPQVGAQWRIVKDDGSFINLAPASGFRGTGRQPHSDYDPAGDSVGTVLSADYRGIKATLDTWTLTKANLDAMFDLIENPQTVLLQAPWRQWYVWIGEAEFEFQQAAAPAAPHPDSVYGAGVVFKWTLPILEVHPGGAL